jgi:hypothetical protein
MKWFFKLSTIFNPTTRDSNAQTRMYIIHQVDTAPPRQPRMRAGFPGDSQVDWGNSHLGAIWLIVMHLRTHRIFDRYASHLWEGGQCKRHCSSFTNVSIHKQHVLLFFRSGIQCNCVEFTVHRNPEHSSLIYGQLIPSTVFSSSPSWPTAETSISVPNDDSRWCPSSFWLTAALPRRIDISGWQQCDSSKNHVESGNISCQEDSLFHDGVRQSHKGHDYFFFSSPPGA